MILLFCKLSETVSLYQIMFFNVFFNAFQKGIFFSAILPCHTTLALSHRVQKSVLYIFVSFAVSHIGLSLLSF